MHISSQSEVCGHTSSVDHAEYIQNNISDYFRFFFSQEVMNFPFTSLAAFGRNPELEIWWCGPIRTR